MKQIITTYLDRLGIATSILCAIHCSVLPMVLAMGVFSGASWMDSHTTEAVFLSCSVFFVFSSLYPSYRKKHKNAMPLVIAGYGFAFFGIGMLLPHTYHIIFSTMGGLSVATAHFINLNLLKKLSH